MKTATVRDLRYDFPKIEAMLRLGEEILITKHNKPFATLLKPKSVPKKTKPALPDFAARRKKIWGDRVFSAQEVEEMKALENRRAMIAYPDTSYLCSVYREQEHSGRADAHRLQMTEPLHVSPLLEFEFKQPSASKYGSISRTKKGYSQAEADQMLADWAFDIATGIVQIISVDHDAVLRMAEHLSQTHTMLSGNRTLDIMHVATGEHLSAKEFLTFDGRQKKLAKAVGLKTPL